MGRLIVQGGRRVLTFASTDTAFAKAPPGIDSYAVPGAGALPGFLGRVLADTKSAINALSARALELQQQVAAARAEFEALDAAGLSAKVAELAGADPMIRDALRAVARERGHRPLQEAEKILENMSELMEDSDPRAAEWCWAAAQELRRRHHGLPARQITARIA